MMKWAMLLCATIAVIADAAGVDDRLFLAAVIFEAAFAICHEIEKTRIGGNG